VLYTKTIKKSRTVAGESSRADEPQRFLYFYYMSKKSWYAVITADVLYNKELSDRQKLLVAVIANLSNEKGYCFASNAHFADMLNTTPRSIQRDLNIIEKAGFLGRVIKIKSTGEVDYRALTPMTPMSPPNDISVTTPHDTDVATPHDTVVIYNNKEVNNKLINNKTKSVVLPFEDLAFKEKWDRWKQYKKEQHKFTYKGTISEQSVLDSLKSLSKNDCARAMELIEHAISKSWSGIFDFGNKKQKQSPHHQNLDHNHESSL